MKPAGAIVHPSRSVAAARVGPVPARFAIRLSTWLGLLAAAWLVSLALASSAEADLCTTKGSGAGECMGPGGVAADTETARVFVTDTGNDRVNAFAADGSFLFAFGWGVRDGAAEAQTCGPEATPPSVSCQAAIPGGGAGQFNFPRAIALDNEALSPDRHFLYVYDSANRRVQKFNEDGEFVWMVGKGVNAGSSGNPNLCTAAGPPTDVCQAGTAGTGPLEFNESIDKVAVGASGILHVSDMKSFSSEPRLQRIGGVGGFLGECEPAKNDDRLAQGLAVDSTGAIYAGFNAGGGVFRFEWAEPVCGESAAALGPPEQVRALAIGAADGLFAAQLEPSAFGGPVHQVITAYDSTGTTLRRFGYDQIAGNPNGLAYLPTAEGDVFASESFFGDEEVPYIPLPPPAPIIVPSSLQVSEIGAIKATIKAEVNPEGKPTDVVIEYVDQESYEAEGFAGPNTKSGPVNELAASFDVQGVEGMAGCTDFETEAADCLVAETEYRWRVVAENEDGQSIVEAEETFQTPEHIEAIFAAQVGSDTARLGARVDPLGIPTTAHMEYVEEASFLESGFDAAVKAPEPESEAPLDFGEGLGAVERSVEVYPLLPGTAYRYRVVVEDPLGQTVGEEVGRFLTYAAEAPSTGCANDATRLGAAAYLPDCRGYEMVSPLDKDGGEIKVQLEFFTNLPAALEQAAVSGNRLAYSSSRAFADSLSAPYSSQYIAERGAGGWDTHAINPPQDGLIKDAVQVDNEYRYFSDDLCQGWLSAFAEYPEDIGQAQGYLNLYRRDDRLCGPETFTPISTGEPKAEDPEDYRLELAGVSADGQVAAFVATDALTGTEAPAIGGDRQLYVKEAGGALRFACVLPNGTKSTSACAAGSGGGVTGTIGNTRLASVANALSEDGRRLYWSNASGDGQIYLRSEPLAGEGSECAVEGAPCTVAVSAGTAHFWGAASDGEAAIYSTGSLSDLDNGTASIRRFEAGSGESTPLAGQSYGVMAIDEEASRVYLVSREELDPVPNQYGEVAAAGAANLYLHDAQAETTRFIARLAAGDADPLPPGAQSTAVAVEPRQHSGRASADGEHAAFLSSAPLTGYDNTDAASGKADAEAFVYDAGADRLVCASCNPSGGRPSGINAGGAGPTSQFWIAARLPAYESTLYAPRVLSEDGSRLYFEASDSLAARDTNSRLDVYQWEEAGKGSCSEADQTYSPPAGGCIELISSGKAAIDSRFLDASPSGDDVFFATLASLYPADPGLIDVYDARVGGGYRPPPAPAAECEGEQCQSPLPAPSFDTPSSQSFAGPGNLAPAPATRCARPARRAKRLATRAKRLRAAARRAKAPAARRKRLRAAKRSARAAAKLSRNAKRCRARARAARRSQ